MKKIIVTLLVFTVLVFAGCSFSFTTASITDAEMTSNIVDGEPVDTVEWYMADTPEFFVVGVLGSAPDDTTIRFVWNYLTDPQEIYEIDVNSEGKNDVYVFSSLENDGLWPIGDYSVEIFIDDREEPDKVVEFSVK